MAFTRTEYPRPQFQRKFWQNLNGSWGFCFDDEERGVAEKFYEREEPFDMRINVPFTYQSKASGLGLDEQHEVMWYRRTFALEDALKGGRVLLSFNAVDYKADVWLNGTYVGGHVNGYTYFSFDVTDYLQDENVLTVKVTDRYDTSQPRGKQFWKREPSRCWYVASSGIWQSVWLEKVGEGHIRSALITPNIDANCISVDFEGQGRYDGVKLTVSYQGQRVKVQYCSLSERDERIHVWIKEEDSIDEIHFWSVERPNLYDLKMELTLNGETVDEVDTYFAFRKISAEKDKILLNNIPLYQKLVLDQGYWEETDLTPPSAESLKEDILLAKKMGFNGGRKHQKVEDPYYYYYADKLGFLVWGEMPSAYQYNLREIGLHTSQYIELVKQLYNHPSVIVWVPLNESWGVRKLLTNDRQKEYARTMYHLTKAMDSSRLVSTNDGWEQVEETDIVSIHDYAPVGDGWGEKYAKDKLNDLFPMARRLMGFGETLDPDKPVIITEYGGVALKLNGVKNLGEEKDGEKWGYAVDNCVESFLKRYENLNRGVFSCEFAGFCYTQLTDVKQEVNGLMDVHHKMKFDPVEIAKRNDENMYK